MSAPILSPDVTRARRHRRGTWLVRVVVAGVAMAAPAMAQQQAPRPAAPAARPAPAAVTRGSNAVVTIVAYRDGSSEVSSGVGVRVSEARVITSLRHLRGASRAEVFDADGDLIGTVTTLDQGDVRLDLGIVRVTQASDSLVLARRSATLKQVVHLLGPRKGTTSTIMERTIMQVEPDETGRTLLRVGVPLGSSSAGSPVVNARSELVGIALGTMPGREDGDIVIDVATLRELLARPINRVGMPAKDGSLSAARPVTAAAATTPAPRVADPAARARSGATASIFPERYGPVVSADTARQWVVELFSCSRLESRQKIYCFLRVTNLSTAGSFGVAGADLTDVDRRKLRAAENLLHGETTQRVAGWRRKAEIPLRELESVRVAIEFAPTDKDGEQLRLMVDVAGERALWFGPVVVQRAP